jgi:hypothetical protein
MIFFSPTIRAKRSARFSLAIVSVIFLYHRAFQILLINLELSLGRQGRQRRSFSDGIQPSSEVFASHIRPVCAASPNKSALLPAQPGSERL